MEFLRVPTAAAEPLLHVRLVRVHLSAPATTRLPVRTGFLTPVANHHLVGDAQLSRRLADRNPLVTQFADQAMSLFGPCESRPWLCGGAGSGPPVAVGAGTLADRIGSDCRGASESESFGVV